MNIDEQAAADAIMSARNRMTPEAQRIAIAEACGWKHDWGDFYHMPDRPSTCHKSNIPDYLNDLNAMHDAEKVLGYEQQDIYARKLLVAVCKYNADAWVWHATAAQRAEALLRTLGLWKD